jgi:hypothetical protein
MKLLAVISVCALFSPLLASPCVRAADPSGSASLGDLRKQYGAASESAAASGRPKLKDPNFSQKLGHWIKVQREQADVGHRLARELMTLWEAAKDGSSDLEAVQQELHQLYQDMMDPPYDNTHERCRFFSTLVRRYVMAADLSKPRAMFLASLTVPHRGIRFCDREAKQGIAGGFWGWDIQDTYVLALARAGMAQQAREENKLLLTKVNLQLKQGRSIDVVPGPLSWKRSFLVHRALLEWLAGGRESAQSFLDDANGLAYIETATAGDAAIVVEVQKGLAATKTALRSGQK